MMYNGWPQTIYHQSIAPPQPVLPASLAKHPQQWTKHEVGAWLKWCSEEYCIDCVPPDKLDMNGLYVRSTAKVIYRREKLRKKEKPGKALCLLGREDFMTRIPKNGDILFNALQKLIQRNTGNVVCSPIGNVVCSPVPAYSNLAATSVGSFTPSSFQPKAIDNLSNGGLLVFSTATTPTTTAYTTPRTSIRPLVPILPQPANKVLSEISLPTVSSVPGVLSPAPSVVDTDDASEDGSMTDPDESDRRQEETTPNENMNFVPVTCPTLPSDQSHVQMIRKDSDCRLLWEFIHQLLLNPQRYSNFVCWENPQEYVFRIIHPTGLAQLWGHQKNRTNMTYEKLSRALRYYYRMNIIKKVSGRRLTYQFLQPPSNIQKGQRGAKPHSKISPPPAEKVKNECVMDDDIPEEDSKLSDLPSSPQGSIKLEYSLVDNLLNDNSFNEQFTTFKTSRPNPSFEKHHILDQNEVHGDVPNGCLSPTSSSTRTSPFSHNPSPIQIKPEMDLQTEPEDLSMATMNKRRLSEEIQDHEDDFQIKRENGNRFPVKMEFKNLNGCS